MSIASLGKRVGRLDSGESSHLSVAETLDLLRARELERHRAWKAARNSGRPPPEPATPIEPWWRNATPADAALWERLAYGRARAAHDRCGHVSPFRHFTHIYAMSETELVQAVNHAEQIVHQTELAAWEAEQTA